MIRRVATRFGWLVWALVAHLGAAEPSVGLRFEVDSDNPLAVTLIADAGTTVKVYAGKVVVKTVTAPASGKAFTVVVGRRVAHGAKVSHVERADQATEQLRRGQGADLLMVDYELDIAGLIDGASDGSGDADLRDGEIRGNVVGFRLLRDNRCGRLGFWPGGGGCSVG